MNLQKVKGQEFEKNSSSCPSLASDTGFVPVSFLLYKVSSQHQKKYVFKK